MKTPRKKLFFRHVLLMISLAGMAGLLAGCQIVALGALATVGTVGVAGYAVYEVGEVSVMGVGEAVQATEDAVVSTGSAMSFGTKSVTVLFADGDFKTQCTGDVKTLWNATDRAFQKAGFKKDLGSFDVLSGSLLATTVDRKGITVKIKSIEPQLCEMKIRVGEKGDLKTSQLIYGLILQELPATPATDAAPAPAKEVKQ